MPTTSMSTRILYIFVFVLYSVVERTLQFGNDVSISATDNRFDKMGVAFVDEFKIENGLLSLSISLDDVVDVDEFWLVDFQPFRFNNLNTVDDVGTLTSSRTGSCSNVVTDAMYPAYFVDNYGLDNQSRLFQNTSIGSIMNNTKREFTFRRNKLSYQGSASKLLNCMRSDGSSAWTTSDITRSEIEYRTTLYFTNIRPKPIHPRIQAVSYVQSHVVLIWRLYRNAFVNVAFASDLSSSILFGAAQRPQVYLDSVVVSTPVDRTLTPIVDQMAVDLTFSTVSPSANYIMVYEESSLGYKPRSGDGHGLLEVVEEPRDELLAAPRCGHHEKCLQTWDSKIVLELNDMQSIQSGKQRTYKGDLVATFSIHECADIEDVTTCNRNATYRCNVTISLVLQSALTLVDERHDEVSLHVVSIHSDHRPVPYDPYGTSHPERAVVADGDSVTFKVQYSPTWLRTLYNLQLLLLVTCFGQGNTEMGCVLAQPGRRMVHYIDPEFHLYVGEKYDSYRLHHEARELATNSNHVYDDEANLHISKFEHSTLTANSALYTVTAVYRLVEKLNSPYSAHYRRKRNRPPLQMNSMYDQVQMTSFTYFAEGCGADQTFDETERSCVEEASDDTISTNQPSFSPEVDDRNLATAVSVSCLTIVVAILLAYCFKV